MIIKLSDWADGLLSAGKVLMANKTVRNAAVGAGVGAVASAVKAPEGKKINSALKGAAVGGVLGGATSVASNSIKSFNTWKEVNAPIAAARGAQLPVVKGIGEALKVEGQNLADSLAAARMRFQAGNTLMH